MERKTVKLFREYQENILRAFEQLRLRDQEEYTRLLGDAEKIVERARKSLPAGEYSVFSTCANRAIEVLGKCHALGLSNLKKRLAEYRILNTLQYLLEQYDNLRQQRAEAQSKSPLAA